VLTGWLRTFGWGVGCWWGGPWSACPGSSRGVALAAAGRLAGDQVIAATDDLPPARAAAEPGALVVGSEGAWSDDGEAAEWLTCEVFLFAHNFPGAFGAPGAAWWGLRGGPGHDSGAVPLHPERCCSVVTPGSAQGLFRGLPTYPAGRLPTYLLTSFPASPPPCLPASHLPVSRIAGGETWPRSLRSGSAFICFLRRNVGHASTSMSAVLCSGPFIGSHRLRVCFLVLFSSNKSRHLPVPISIHCLRVWPAIISPLSGYCLPAVAGVVAGVQEETVGTVAGMDFGIGSVRFAFGVGSDNSFPLRAWDCFASGAGAGAGGAALGLGLFGTGSLSWICFGIGPARSCSRRLTDRTSTPLARPVRLCDRVTGLDRESGHDRGLGGVPGRIVFPSGLGMGKKFTTRRDSGGGVGLFGVFGDLVYSAPPALLLLIGDLQPASPSRLAFARRRIRLREDSSPLLRRLLWLHDPPASQAAGSGSAGFFR
jgi:hypothetical protein